MEEYQKYVEETKATKKYQEKQLEFENYQNIQKTFIKSFFHHKIMKNKKKWNFDCSISTDGIAVSLQFSKVFTIENKEKSNNNNENLEPNNDYNKNLPTIVNNTIVVGADPGRNNLVFMAYKIDDKNMKTWKLTRGQYYNESGIKKINNTKQKDFKDLIPKWTTLGSDESGICTSKTSNIKEYLRKYLEIEKQWWILALRHKESRHKLQAYIGKRKVIDSFYSTIKKEITKLHPGCEIKIAYGSAHKNMKATVAAPVGPMYKSCCRAFPQNVAVVDEYNSTSVKWETGTKKEKVYKKILSFEETKKVKSSVQKHTLKIKESLHHTTDTKMPIITSQDDIDLQKQYQNIKYVQGKKRRGSFLSDKELLSNKKETKKEKKPRFLEVRGLRGGMYLDRDREAALTIARLHCMEILGLPRPLPFSRASRAMSS